MGFWTMIAIFSTKNGILFDKRVERRSFTQESAVMFKIVRFPKNKAQQLLALLTHIAIGEGAKAKRKSAVKLSTADLQNEARRIVWNDLADHLKKLSSGTQVVKELERLLIAA
jgi:hypothetical protein